MILKTYRDVKRECTIVLESYTSSRYQLETIGPTRLVPFRRLAEPGILGRPMIGERCVAIDRWKKNNRNDTIDLKGGLAILGQTTARTT